MVVDGVSDVIALTPEQLKPAPNLGAALDADYIAGLGALDGRRHGCDSSGRGRMSGTCAGLSGRG